MLLYEMATGRRAFPGGPTAEALAAVVRDEPKAPTELVPTLPRDLERLIQRCLRKQPGRRFHSMADVRLELEQIEEDSQSRPALAPVTARRRRRHWLAMTLGGVVILAGMAAWLWRAPRAPVSPPRLVPLTSMRGSEWQPTFSPDGEQVGFMWAGERDENFDIYLTMIGSSEIRRLTTDPSADTHPRWSPDGRQIAFLRWSENHQWPQNQATIHLVSPLGGSARKVSDFPVGVSQLSWSPDGRFLAAMRAGRESVATPGAGGIHLVALDGGEPRALTRAKPGANDREPALPRTESA